jgi:sarcosine oxidase
MPAQPHVLVLGLGIAGSSIAATLAANQCRVTAFEQFAPLHERGSSHGDTRIYRRIPHEGPAYVDMASASWDGWRNWGTAFGEDLLVACGGVDAGPDGSAIVDQSEKLCREHGKPCTIMTGSDLNKTYPHYNLPASWKVAYQPESGFVRPDAARTFLHRMARSHGARLLHETRVLGIDAAPHGVSVRTAQETVTGDILIVSAGSWLPQLVPDLNLDLNTERRVIAWFDPDEPEPMGDGRFPIFCMDADGGWYGMPTPDGAVKLGHDKHLSQVIDPGQPSLVPDEADAALLSGCIERYFRGLSPRPSIMKPCIYTITRDHHFIIDRHPANENVILFSCCSGHGFKYGPAYGEIALGLVRGKTAFDLSPFRLDRDTSTPATRYGE